MGHGLDETGVKGVLIAELDQETSLRFLPVEGPRFYDFAVPAGEDPTAAVEAVLPGGGSGDHYRVRLTGECPAFDAEALERRFARFPNLKILDETVRVAPLWEKAEDDNLEGVYFRILRDALRTADGGEREDLELAAKLSRSILQGQEVVLP